MSRFKLDLHPMEWKRPGTEGYLTFHKYKYERVIVTEWCIDDDMPEWAVDSEDFDVDECLWLRRVDGKPFEHEDSESIMRDDMKECAFHHQWFIPANDWDAEDNNGMGRDR